MKLNKYFYIVNSITTIRLIGALLLIPIYFMFGYFGLGIAVAIFVSTDSIDGYLARKHKCATFFGAIYDAISDKLFNFIVLILLSLKVLPMLLVLFMEILIFAIAYKSTIKGNKSRTIIIGKIKMIVVSFNIVLMLFLLDYDKLIMFYNLPIINTKLFIIIIAIIILLFEFIAVLSYVFDYLNNSKENKLVKRTLFEEEMVSENKIKEMLFSPEFYQNNKDKQLSKLVLKNKN